MRKTWLVINPASGSYDEDAFAELMSSCERHGIAVDRVIRFPEEDLPTGDELEAAGMALVTIFTGDGSINALVTRLYGWGGAVLVLPGGTMNLLAGRLHGDVSSDAILGRVAADRVGLLRPTVVRCDGGDALAGLMVGPGTAWNSVREAMRRYDVPGMAAGAAEAIGESTGGARIRLIDPPLGEPEGYPLVLMTPDSEGMELKGYIAQTIAEYAQQGVALLKRDFREGPHDNLGQCESMTMQSEDDRPIDALIDGEPARLPPRATFRQVPCEVDLVVSRDG